MKKKKTTFSFKLLTLMVGLLLAAYSLPLHAQFTTDKDTLLFITGDSLSCFVSGTDTSRVFDLEDKILVGVNFDTTSAWTADHFIILTSSTYSSAADTFTTADANDIGNWSVVYYDGTIFSFDPITYDENTTFDNYFQPVQLYGFKRYIMFKAIDSSNDTDTEDADRKMVILIRGSF